MEKCLFIVCPTDCLEPIINKTFDCENYFYTSLGNTFCDDSETLMYLTRMVKKHSIKNICFVLSFDNRIVSNALKNSELSSIPYLRHLHKDMNRQQSKLNLMTTDDSYLFTLLSYHLNEKIKTLNFQLSDRQKQTVTVRGKIYNRKEKIFTSIYSNLICLEQYHLN